MKLPLSLAAILAVAAAAPAAAAAGVSFPDTFNDSTLRVTYAFAGDAQGAKVFLESLEVTPGWAGRRANLGELPLLGNGQVFLTAENGDTIYATSFTTLFHEWVVTDDARVSPKSFSYSFLLPLPKQKADIHVRLIDKYQKPVAQAVHAYDPADILVRRWKGTPADYVTIHQGSADPARAVDVAFVGDGYTASQDSLFIADAQAAASAILNHEPFKQMADRFNFIAVPTHSVQEGVSLPRLGDWKDTSFDSHYSTLYSDRYLTSPSSVKAHEALRGIPYEHIIILANTDEYGGGGFYNVITTAAAHHPTMPPVMVHEFGHSFAGLADEYFYPGDQLSEFYAEGVEPWEMNITNLTDFTRKPWHAMLPAKQQKSLSVNPDADADTVQCGIFEGGGYIGKGMYRPAFKCRMRVNDWPVFCPVCTKAIIDIIDFNTLPSSPENK